MAAGPKKPDSKKRADTDEGLSPRAREVKRLLAEGRYKVDLAGLADRLLESGALDDALPGDEGDEVGADVGDANVPKLRSVPHPEDAPMPDEGSDRDEE